MRKESFVTSLGFTAAMTVISLIMLVKSYVVASRVTFDSGIYDLAIWGVMALTWVIALILRLRSRRKSGSGSH